MVYRVKQFLGAENYNRVVLYYGNKKKTVLADNDNDKRNCIIISADKVETPDFANILEFVHTMNVKCDICITFEGCTLKKITKFRDVLEYICIPDDVFYVAGDHEIFSDVETSLEDISDF